MGGGVTGWVDGCDCTWHGVYVKTHTHTHTHTDTHSLDIPYLLTSSLLLILMCIIMMTTPPKGTKQPSGNAWMARHSVTVY